MKKLVVWSLPAWVVALLMLAGCGATYHRAQYVSTVNEPRKPVDAAKVETRIAENFDREVHALYGRGYELIGYAQFTSPLQPQFAQVNARWAAEHYGATYVLLAPPSQRGLNQYFYLTTFWRPVKPERFILGAYYDDGPPEVLALVGCEQNMVLVRAVVPGTPAERMGLKSGDIIASVDDQPVDDARALDELLLAKAGREVHLGYQRSKEAFVVRGRLSAVTQPARASLDRGTAAGLLMKEGELNDELVKALGRKQGVFVAGVRYGSPACSAGLRAGDVIASMGGEPIDDVQDVRAALEKSAGRKLAITVLDGEAKQEVTLDRTAATLTALEPLKRLDLAEAGYDDPWTRTAAADYTWAAVVSLTAQGVGAGYNNYLQQQEAERRAQVQAYNQMQAYRRAPAADAPPLPTGYVPGGRRGADRSGAPPGYRYSRRQAGLVPIDYTARPYKVAPVPLKWNAPDPLQAFLGELGYLNYNAVQIANSWNGVLHAREERERKAYEKAGVRPGEGRKQDDGRRGAGR
jgi:membrane-associated protease RseP (regulator of RpoE activity)